MTTHNNWPDFNNHEVLTLEQLAKPENQSKAKAKPRCNKKSHGNQPLDFFCNTCNELVCLTCVVLDHPKPDHECEPIDVAANRQKEALMTTSAILQTKSDAGHDALKEIRGASENMEVNYTKAKTEILHQKNEILDAFTKKLEHTMAPLIVELDRKHNEVNEKLSKQHDDMKVYVKKVNGSLEFVNNIIEKGSNEDILSLGNEIKENASDIEKKCPKMMMPVHSGFFEYRKMKSTENIMDEDLKELGKICKFAFLLLKK